MCASLLKITFRITSIGNIRISARVGEADPMVLSSRPRNREALAWSTLMDLWFNHRSRTSQGQSSIRLQEAC